jgi:protein-disulfide isomerase
MRKLQYQLLVMVMLAIPAAGQTADPAATTKTSPNATGSPTSTVDCGCEAAPLPEVLAVLNGVKITKQDLSPETQTRVAKAQEQVVEARQRELDLQINSILLESEAKRLNISTQKLLENEIIAKAQEPTEADARKFYDENKTRISGEFAAVKNDIITYLRDVRQRELAGKLAARLRAAANVQILVKDVAPPAKPAERGRVFATVNDQRITSADIEDSLAPLIFNVQEQTYLLRKRDLDLKINDILLAGEAQKRKVTTRALLESEVDTKVPPITETQAQTFYNENKARITVEFAQAKEEIMKYLRETETQRLGLEFATRLQQAAAIQIFINPPPAPVIKIATDNQPMKGSPSAAVTLVAFTDFQCPACGQTQSVLEKLLGEYGDRVRLVVRDFPLTEHAHAFKAAEAAEAARAQNKYWEYAGLLFANQSALELGQLKEYAGRLGLDRTKFDTALDGGIFADNVRRDQLDGERAGVFSTPTIFVNGRRAGERTYEGLKAAIEAALKAAPAR